MLTSNDLRQLYLDFMVSKGHKIHPGISLVPTDPSIFLTTAGVVPFQAMLEGREPAPHPRVASCQRCCRTGDLERVGKFARYHTLFEMLGNWSFGDYFKREAIVWGWEFSTEVLKLDPERIWATIYPDDDESYDIWTKDVGLPADRLLRLDDNWWGPVLETGACGPDSEFYYDLGPEFGCGSPDCKPGCDCDRYLEYWNLVFTERYHNADGTRGWLKNKNIDTGLGLERLTCVVQNRRSVYETDLFAPMMDAVDGIVERATGSAGERTDWRKRVIADHCRAAAFMVMDGIYPANVGRGYVLRRIIRRASTFGYLLGVRGAFLHEIVPAVIDKMEPGYPELREKQDIILKQIRDEEERFAGTLDRGVPQFLDAAESGKLIDGAFAYNIRSTYGVPFEVMLELAEEKGAGIDEAGYRRAEQEHRGTSGKGIAVKQNLEVLGVAATEFTGYTSTHEVAQVLMLLHDGDQVDSLQAGETGTVILNRSPFYAESGGQVGDIGSLQTGVGGVSLAADVLDTQKRDGIWMHSIRVEQGRLHIGMTVVARVDDARRLGIRRAHTATHLLHASLRSVLGAHVVQRGSVVEPDRLRFDFAHGAAATLDEIRRVEELMNAEVLRDVPLVIEQHSQEEARQMGAMMLFGEKYGEVVRVVQVPGFSTELCGGIHAASTGTIGLIKIVAEGSAAAGVRRIECTTGMASLQFCQAQVARIRETADTLGGAVDQIGERIQALKDQVSQLRRQVAEARRSGAGSVLETLLQSRRQIGAVTLVSGMIDAGDVDTLKAVVDQAADRTPNSVVIVGGAPGGRGVFVAKVAPDATAAGAHAGNLVREVAKLAGGSGGGRPEFAQAGARDTERMPAAIESAAAILAAQVGA